MYICASYRSPLGRGHLLWRDGKVLLLTLPGTDEGEFRRMAGRRLGREAAAALPVEDHPAAREVEEYLAGRRREFSFAVDPPGTAFQRRVWEHLRGIPYGATATYGEIARRMGRPGAARAVGAACRANPVALAIPCHRVIGAGGDLTGFGGGLALKERLLRLEAGFSTSLGTYSGRS